MQALGTWNLVYQRSLFTCKGEPMSQVPKLSALNSVAGVKTKWEFGLYCPCHPRICTCFCQKNQNPKKKEKSQGRKIQKQKWKAQKKERYKKKSEREKIVECPYSWVEISLNSKPQEWHSNRERHVQSTHTH